MATLQEQANQTVDENTDYDDGPCGSYARGHDIFRETMLLTLRMVRDAVGQGDDVLAVLARMEAEATGIQE
jgi:hypothetical protein